MKQHIRGITCKPWNTMIMLFHTDPQYAGAWHEKGNCLDEPGWWEEALARYDEALMNDPCNHETWV